MGPQSKKRKIQPTAGPESKRPKNLSSKPKSKPKTPRRAVDAAALGWQSFDIEQFGDLQVIENVEVVKEGNKVQFLVAGEKAAEETQHEKDEAFEEFEGFGDDDVAAPDVVEAEIQEKSEETKGEEQPKDKKKAKKEKRKQVTVADTKLASSKTPEGNSFDALANESAEDDQDIDTAAWEALNLSPSILSAIANLKFATPTNIQAQTIPEILAGEDVIGKAQTGSGKTLAFGIPIVEKWLDIYENEEGERPEREGPLAVVLSPTRELAKQLGDHLKALCDGLPSAPYIVVVTGGLSIQKQQRQLIKADIVIGTPGRLWEVLEGDATLQNTFTKIKFLVVDEADRLFKAGQFKEAEDIIGALDKGSKPEEENDSDDEELSPRQTLVFSATFDKELQTKLAGTGRRKKKGADEEDKMAYLMKCLQFRKEPKFIDASPTKQMAEGLKEGLIECGAMEKDLYLYTVLLLNPKRRTLVFTNSISAVRRVTPFLTNLQLNAMPLHSQMAQKARLRSLEKFTEAKQPAILVATDVAARGLDISEVDCVLHYHVPRAADTYVHRSGRTARGIRTGTSILLCAPEEVLPTRRLAGKVHSKKSGNKREHVIQTLPIDRKLASRLKPRVELAKKLADAYLAKEKARSDDNFMRTAAEELGVEYDSSEETPELGWGGRGGGRKRKDKIACEITKAEMGAMRAALREELGRRVNLGVSERYITGGRVDVGALLREREKSGVAGAFLGTDGLGFDF